MEGNNEWVLDYLKLFNSYVQPGVSFGNLNTLNFCILKSEKTSRAKARFEIPSIIGMDEANKDLEVVMVTLK